MTAPASATGSTRGLDRAGLDARIERLREGSRRWSALSPQQRGPILNRCIDGLLEVADDWVRAACRAKQGDARVAAEEWLSGPATVARGLRLYRETLLAGGAPQVKLRRAHGRQLARVFPARPVDHFLYFGLEADLWIRPDADPTQGALYRQGSAGDRGVALVLGAGNVGSIGPMDVLHKLVAEGQTVLLKMNPVNAYLGPLLRRGLKPLVEGGWLEVVEGDAEVGAYLTDHPGIDAIHLTGSGATHDAIVWGPGAEGEARRRAGTPRLAKAITSELGCVTPVLVVPGRWSRSELDFQARQVASMVAHNASFNCNAAKVLVVDGSWEQREPFLKAVEHALRRAPTRHAYYPGAAERHRAFLDHYPAARALSPHPADGHLPWTLLPDVPARPGEYALTHEAFCGVLAVVQLDAGDGERFLQQAVDLANAQIEGTLSCSLMIDPRSERELAGPLATALERLRYGGIGINVWPGAQFFLGQPSWGAYPGQTLQEVGSGIGWVHNTSLFDHPEKTVVRMPFRTWPKPVWFADHRSMDRLGRRLALYEARPSTARLLSLGPAAASG